MVFLSLLLIKHHGFLFVDHFMRNFRAFFPPLSKFTHAQTDVIKGFGILFIVLHNYFHWVWPSPGENEFDFSGDRIGTFFQQIGSSPLEIINLLFSYFGHYGVQLFIVISGYGLAMSANKKGVHYFSFVFKRFAKIYPSFLMAVAILIGLMVFSSPASLNAVYLYKIKLKLLLIANFYPGEALTINGPWWFYSMIFQLYLLFPLFWWLDKKSKGMSFPVLSILTLGFIFFMGTDPLGNKLNLMQNFAGHLPEFLLGVFIANRKNLTLSGWVWPAALVLFILGNFYSTFWLLTFVSVSWLLILAVQRIELSISENSIIRRFLVFYGSVSMYLFAVHGFLRMPFVDLANKDFIPWKTLLLAIPFLLVSTILALSMMLLEKWIRKQFDGLSWNSLKEAWKCNVISWRIKHESSAMSFFARWWIILFVIFFITRIAEYILLTSGSIAGSASLFERMISGLFMEFKLWMVSSVIIYLPWVIIYRIYRPAGRIILISLVCIIAILNMALMKYFSFTLAPLDQVVYSYTWERMMDTVSSSGGFSFGMWLPIIILVLIFAALIRWFPPLHISRSLSRLLVAITLVFFFARVEVMPNINRFHDDLSFFITQNKAAYFIRTSADYFFFKNKNDMESEGKISELAADFQAAFPQKNYLGKRFPFLHYNDCYDDVLSPFFEFSGKKPNIVIVVMESLGSAYSGPGAYLGSFTPFIDSLAGHSLYWENFLSTSQRTFEVMPSLLGSLPYGTTGFMNYNASVPDHRTLLSILKENGYFTTFNYGGDPDFDQMKAFFLRSNVDFMMLNRDTTLTTVTENEAGNWGYPDHEMYRKSLKALDSIAVDSLPRLEVLLSLSMHIPFNIPYREKYQSQVKKMIKNGMIPEKSRDLVRKNIKAFASVLYGDASLRYYMDNYRKRPDFNNTIFIITGDHHIGNFGDRDHLDKYRVPLLIYSPMLKKPVAFKSISSHLDVTPSLLAMLQKSHNIQLPQRAAWLGNGIDTVRKFQMKQSLPFILNSREIIEYADHGFYHTRGRLYKISEGLQLEPVTDEWRNALLAKRLEAFVTLSTYVSQFNRLIAGKNFAENNGLTTLYDLSIDFDRPDLDTNFLTQIERSQASSGKNCLKLSKDIEYGMMMPSLTLDDDYSALYTEIKCRINPLETVKENMPILVFNLFNVEGKSVHWQSFPIMNLDGSAFNKNEWHSFSTNIRQDLLQWDQKQGYVVKLYIWNYKKTDFLYDDLSIKIQAEK